MGLGIDGTVIGNCVDLLALTSNLGDCVLWCILELLNELVHNIDKDNLFHVGCQCQSFVALP